MFKPSTPGVSAACAGAAARTIYLFDIVEDYPEIGGVASVCSRLRRQFLDLFGARLVLVRDIGHRLGCGDRSEAYMPRERRAIERLAAIDPDSTFFIPNFQSPLVRRPGLPRPKVVNIVHDVQFSQLGHLFTPEQLKSLRAEFTETCANADAVAFVSQATRDQYVGLFGAPERCCIIPAPIASVAPGEAPPARAAPFLLAVQHGLCHPHKNVAGLMRLFAGLAARRADLMLVVAGRGDAEVREAREALPGHLRDRVTHVGHVPRAELTRLYRGAEAFVSLSLFEGFNMPAAEAASCGTPLILSDLPVHRELHGETACFLDPAGPDLDRAAGFLSEAAPRLRGYAWKPASACTAEAVARAHADLIAAVESDSAGARPAAGRSAAPRRVSGTTRVFRVGSGRTRAPSARSAKPTLLRQRLARALLAGTMLSSSAALLGGVWISPARAAAAPGTPACAPDGTNASGGNGGAATDSDGYLAAASAGGGGCTPAVPTVNGTDGTTTGGSSYYYGGGGGGGGAGGNYASANGGAGGSGGGSGNPGAAGGVFTSPGSNTRGSDGADGTGTDGGGGGGGGAYGGSLAASGQGYSGSNGGNGGAGGGGAVSEGVPEGFSKSFFASVANASAGGGGGGGGGVGTGISGTGVTVSGPAYVGGDGGAGGASLDALGGNGGNGGVGTVVLGGSSLTLATGSTGGAGGAGGSSASLIGGNGGNGGDGMDITASSLTITASGSITGGAGGLAGSGASANGTPGAGGFGILGDGVGIVNSGSIAGGLSGDGTIQADALHLTSGSNTLTLQAGGTLSGNIFVGPGASLYFGPSVGGAQPAANVTLSNVITGQGSIIVGGPGLLSFAASNTYSGGTTISAGTLSLGHAQGGIIDAAGTGGINLGGGTLELAVNGTLANTNSLTLAAGATATIAATPGTTATIGSPFAFGAGGTAIFGSPADTGTIIFAAPLATTDMPATLEVGGGVLQAGSPMLATITQGAATTRIDPGGTLDLNSNTATISNLQGGGTLLNGLRTTTIGGGAFAGNIGSGAVVSTGLLTLSGTSTYGDATTVSGGRLEIAAGGSIAQSVSLTNNATFQVDAGGAASFTTTINNGALSNAGSLHSTTLLNAAGATLTSTGVLGVTLLDNPGAINISGTLSAGTLNNRGTFNVAGALNASITQLNQRGGTIDLGGNQIAVAGLTLIGGTIQNGTLTASSAFDLRAGTISAVLGGAVGLNKTDVGTVVLFGANSFTGPTNIAGGTLALSGGGSLAASAGVIDNAVLDISGVSGGSTTIASLSGAGALALGGTTLILSNASGSYAGSLGAAGDTGGLTVAGGTETLASASVNYAGATTIGAGASLLVTGTTSLASSSGVTANGVFDISGLGGGSTNIATLSGTGAVMLGGNTLVLSSASGLYAGTLGGAGDSGGFTLADGTETLASASVNYAGATTIRAGATLILTGTTSLASSSGVTANGTFDISGVAGGSATIASLSGGGTVALGGNTLILSSASGTYAGTLGATGDRGGLTLAGGTETLASASVNYAGATTIRAGASLLLTGTTSLASSSGVTGNGLFDISGIGGGSTTIATLSGAGAVNLGGNTLILSNASGTYGGKLGAARDTGGFTVAGGTETLASASVNYAGATTIGAGATLILTGTTSLATSSGVIANGVFDVSGQAGGTSLQSLSGGPGGSVSLGANGLTLTNASGSFAGIISGAGGVNVAGGTEVLTGANTFSGGTTVGSGVTLQVGNSNSLGTGSVFLNGGTLQAATDGLTLKNPAVLAATATIDTQGFGLTYAGTISGAGGLSKAGTGTLILTRADSYTGGTTIGSGTLQIGAGGTSGAITGDVTDNGALVFDRSDGLTFAGTITGSGSLTQAGTGELTLAAANSYTGGTTLAAGILQIGNGAALGSGSLLFAGGSLRAGADGLTVPNPVQLSGAGKIDTQGFTLSLTGEISGPGPLQKSGSGTLFLGQANSYAGGTLLQQGTLALGNGGALGTGRLAMDQNTTLLFSQSLTLGNDIAFTGKADPTIDTAGHDSTISGTISGPGALTKQGAGILTLTADNPYTGATTIAAGTLDVEGSIAASATTVANGGTLSGSGTVGRLVVQAGGMLTPGSAVNPYGRLSVSGPASFAPGATYGVAINAAGQSNSLAVAGAATPGGAGVAVAIATGAYDPGTRYTVLTASGGVNGMFGAISTASALAFLNPYLSYAANTVTLAFQSNGVPFSAVATTPNQRAVANALQGLDPNSPVYRSLKGLSADQARLALDALAGASHASAITAATQDASRVQTMLFDRLWTIGGGELDARTLLQQMNAPNNQPTFVNCFAPMPKPAAPPTVYTAWGEGFGDFGHDGGNQNGAGLDHSLGGFILGLDAPIHGLGAPYRVGIAGGYTNDRFTSTGTGGGGASGTSESVFGAVYGGTRYGAVDVRLGASVAHLSTDSNRSASYLGFYDAEHSDYGGSTVQGFGEIGYRFSGPRYVFEPIFAAGYTHVHQDAFHEDGGPAALLGFAQDSDVGTTTLGARGEVAPITGVPLVARAFLGWRHAFGDINPETKLAFLSTPIPFTSQGAPVDTDALAAELGLDWRYSAAMTFGVSYVGQISSRDDDHGVKGRVEYKF